ncbi:tetratricopeptide repeat protein [Lutimonas zeaxanthinifaciens]|uniref:tetratricopeptide repeat protein n=1 Tax=Lutimonas zeaxanthinifaciens TaxID=3060215 RepID=UPI00265D0E31|nr:tetratricopeptide repeat protein [Lutimonas sp. YSD2104]WKK64920.1 tetratricopeptide repeat protein [Lutimonas sp. YSD2104]
MQHFSNNNDNQPLSKFELMLKTNSVYFFDSNEFEEIILFYVDSGKFSLAKKALHLGLSQHPTSVSLQLIQVELLILDENLDKAEKILDRLQEIEPSNEDIYIQKATIFSKRGKHNLAVDNLKTALIYADDDAEILSMIGMEYLFLEDFDTARFNFAKSLDVEYENYSSLYNVIYCFDMMKKHDEAIDYLKNYIEKEPYSEIAWHQLGRQYYIVYDYQKALEAFEYSILIDEEFIGAHLEKAKTLEELGHYEEAIQFYHKTMELDTPTSFAYLRIGKCYEKLNSVRDAIDFYNKTVNEDPLLDKGWLALTDIYISNKNYHKALFYINKALGIDEENNLYWHKFAEINLKLNLFEEAARAYYKCIGLHDDRIEVYLALSDVLHFLGEFHESIRVLLDARESYKDEPEITYRLAGLHFLVQKEKEGLFFFEKSLKSDIDFLSVASEIFPTMMDIESVKLLIEKFQD